MKDNGMNPEDIKLWQRFNKVDRCKSRACPDDNLWAGYLDGKLVGSKLDQVEAHMAVCSICLDKLIEMRMLLGIETGMVPVSIKQGVKDLVSEIPGQAYAPSSGFFPLLWRPWAGLNERLGWVLASCCIVVSYIAGTQMGVEALLLIEKTGIGALLQPSSPGIFSLAGFVGI